MKHEPRLAGVTTWAIGLVEYSLAQSIPDKFMQILSSIDQYEYLPCLTNAEPIV